MTYFAPVGPLVGLEHLSSEALGTYQLLIAPVILYDPRLYREFFLEHDDQFVIVDNGIIEGDQLGPEELAHAASIVDAQLVVMPDTVDDGPDTVRKVAEALPAFRRVDSATDTMGVVQGTTFEECMECARALASMGVDWLSAPRGLTKNLGSRVPLVLSLAAEFGLPQHVLGFSDNIADDLMAATAHRSVRGIDAATPMWLQHLLPTRPPEDSRFLGRRPADFWTMAKWGCAEDNVQTVRRWLSVAQQAGEAKDEEWEDLTHTSAPSRSV